MRQFQSVWTQAKSKKLQVSRSSFLFSDAMKMILSEENPESEDFNDAK